MKKLVLAALIGAFAAAPAYAAGGLHCRTGGARPIQVSLTYGHVFGTPLVASRLLDNGRNVPVSHAQWWFDQRELRLLLTDPNATRRELIIKARRNGQAYDGDLWRGGKRRWVRCRES
jgi:hypothetical protein